ncbi:hypothetical protein LXL04_006822 [Taraxacum kok-saghyz]
MRQPSNLIQYTRFPSPSPISLSLLQEATGDEILAGRTPEEHVRDCVRVCAQTEGAREGVFGVLGSNRQCWWEFTTTTEAFQLCSSRFPTGCARMLTEKAPGKGALSTATNCSIFSSLSPFFLRVLSWCG